MTFRLADSLPQRVLAGLEAELVRTPAAQRASKRVHAIERWLDQGLGCCALAHPVMAKEVQRVLKQGHGSRYQLLAWCIMPNHLHVLLQPAAPLARIVQAWKSLTTRWARAHHRRLGLDIPQGSLWQRDYWDNYIRNEDHLQRVIHYIHQNPVKAGLVADALEWRWSSASRAPAELAR